MKSRRQKREEIRRESASVAMKERLVRSLIIDNTVDDTPFSVRHDPVLPLRVGAGFRQWRSSQSYDRDSSDLLRPREISEPDAKTMRYSDRPISHPHEDVLGRSDFAQALAYAIDELAVARDGFVIGLIGDWGSGKSSVVELALKYLLHKEMADIAAKDGPSISIDDFIEMSVQFSKIEPIITSLKNDNRDLRQWLPDHRDGEFLRACGSHENAAAAMRYWTLLQKVELGPRNVVVRFSPWLIAGKAELASALISDLARAAGQTFGEGVRRAFASLLSRLAQVAPIAGAAVDVATGAAFGGLFSAGLDVSDKLAKRMTTGPTLDGVRTQLRNALAALDNRKIVVIVDDLDRLTPTEAAEMVSLVKGLGDLPNVVYVLCYDEKRLTSLLDTALELSGGEYLQKIVQYPVHLPPLEADDLAGC